jgi:hypothetical protein
MKKLVLTAALGAGCLALAACGDNATNTAEANNGAAAAEAEGAGNAAGGTATASAAWQGARIVEENGVTYRVNADGTRVQLGANESRIVVENGTRYRVDPDGSRVRIDPEGVEIDVDLPDVDIGINNKGNPDIDVGDRDPDGGR